VQDQLFKIVDRSGAVLALRPEMTVPIARLTATRLAQDSMVLRLAYVAEVFRGQEAGQGRLREFTQAGVELIGEGSLQGDAEVIALAATALRRAGLTDVIVNIGHLGFLRELMTELSTDEQDDIRGRLYRKDFPGIEEMVARHSRARVLRDLPQLHGPEAIARARALPSSSVTGTALDELERLLDQLQVYGVGAWVGIDLGIIRDFSYYTGIVFEAYGLGMGAPLLGGGRYDGLLGRFGVDQPATGFALGLERIIAALPQGPVTPVALLLRDGASIRPETIRLAVELREQGIGVILGGPLAWPEASRRAEAEGVRWVGYLEGTRVQLQETGTTRQTSVNRDQLDSVLTGRGEGIAWSR